MVGNSRNFKSIMIYISDADKKAAMVYLVKHGDRPSLRNTAAILKEWAIQGIEKTIRLNKLDIQI